MKEVKVQLTLEWTFDNKQWKEEQKHIHELEEDVKQISSYDIISSLFFLNEMAYPEVKKCKVASV
mgnify:CR=1 FL=1|jgi:hypothetical protein|tara:strand:+ start:103 stop:297 length:195 start_codon:yes stop_codon:yes gene_type:complete